MDFKNTLTAYNEHVAQIEEAKKIMMNAPAEVFGKYYHDFDFGVAEDEVVMHYMDWKMKQGNLTFEVLKEKQTITVADFLKKRILRFTPPPTKRELDEVNLELVTYYLPHGYDLPEEFKNWCAQFSRFISWEDDILIIDYNTYGKYLFDCLSMLSREERVALLELDATLLMIHEDMRKIRPELRKKPGDSNHHFAITNSLKMLLGGEWFKELRTEDRYDKKWIEDFVDSLMKSEWSEMIAEDWKIADKRLEVKCRIVGALKDAGVLKGSYLAIARGMGDMQKKVDTLAKYMGQGKEQPYFDWIKDYVKTPKD